jgi:pimeloyl-ACP methyl ester carboxylesterase
MRHLPTLVAACLAFTAPLSAQNNGIDPPVDGRYIEHVDQPLTFSDGYRTLADIRYPVVEPNPGGWPIVVLVHGGGKSRDQVLFDGRALARRGYATIAFDARGQGPGAALNNPNDYGYEGLQLRERIDLAEALEGAAALFPDKMDLGRVGITGRSQGAAYSWIAAAHSGRSLPNNPWRSKPFPTFLCAVPINYVPDLVGGVFPGGETISEAYARALFDPNSGIEFEPSFFSFMDDNIRAEDFAAIANEFSEAELFLPDLLKTSSVPVLASVVYDDRYTASNSLLKAWPDILPNTPKMLNFTSDGHSSPDNVHQAAVLESKRNQWFDHFLKMVPNDIANQPEFRLALTPPDAVEYADVDTLWDQREFDSFPPAGSSERFWYLDKNGDLSVSNSAKQSFEIDHQVNSSAFGIDDYLSALPQPEALQQIIPLKTLSWESDTFQEDVLMIGEAVARLRIKTDDENVQIQASLFEEPSGRFIQGGFVTLRNLGDYRFDEHVDIAIGVQGYVFRKGTRLRLQIENLAWHRPPNPAKPTSLRGIPIFDDFKAEIWVGWGYHESTLTIPLVPLGGPSLIGSLAEIERVPPSDVLFEIYSDSSRSGWSYEMLVSASGTEPGYIYNGEHVPLNRDWLTDKVENSNGNLPLHGWSGVLDSDGRASADALLSNFNALPGRIDELDFVLILTGPQGETKVSPAYKLPVVD